MTQKIDIIFFLFVLFQVKHFVADFPLQREYMLKKVSPDWDFLIPLAVHSAVHASFTMLIVVFIDPSLWWLAVVDFVVHFVMDRIKAGPKYLGRYDDKDRAAFWNCLGFDQMVHHLTHMAIIYALTLNM